MTAGTRAWCALIVAGALVTAAGCDDENPAAPPGAVQVVTDASTYVMGVPVRGLLVNGGGNTVYTLSCTAFATLEVRKPEGWTSLGAWYLMCDGPTVLVPLAPGTYLALPEIDAATEADLGAGTYRLRVDVYNNDTFPYLSISEDQRVSEPFALVDKNQ